MWVDAERLAAAEAWRAAVMEPDWWRALEPLLALGEVGPDDGDCKLHVRLGSIPDELRGQVWYHVSGGHAYARDHPDAFKTACLALLDDSAAGAVWPSGVYDLAGAAMASGRFIVPNFGSDFDAARLCLSEGGQRMTGFMLCCLAFHEFPSLSYCPWLPVVVAASLHWLDPPGAFCVACAFVRRANRPIDQDPLVLPSSKLASWQHLKAAEDVAARRCRKSYAAACRASLRGGAKRPELTDEHPLRGMYFDWLANRLQFWPLTRFMDSLMVEGSKAIFRFALAIVNAWYTLCIAPDLPPRGRRPIVGTYKRIKRAVRGYPVPPPVDPVPALDSSTTPQEVASLINQANLFVLGATRIRFSRAELASSFRKSQQECEAALTATGGHRALLDKTLEHIPPLPPQLLESGVLAPPQWQELWRYLPRMVRTAKPVNVFSTSRHGYTLRRLYEACGETAPTVVLVKSAKHTFGAFATSSWSERSDKYFGKPSTFVFSFGPFHVSQNAGSKGSILLATNELLCVGGGGEGPAITLDGELKHCTCVTSQTFENKPLAPSYGADPFPITTVEVWSLEVFSAS